jgi:hypothetical protein
MSDAVREARERLREALRDDGTKSFDYGVFTDRILTAAEALLSALDESEWRPIETAVDAKCSGTSILGYCPEMEQRYGAVPVQVIIWGPTVDEVYDGWIADDETQNYREPTHWMPLPDPPSDGGQT